MQRVSSLLPTWERTRSVDGRNRSSSSTGASSPKNSQSSNSGAFGRVFGWADRITPSRISGSTATHSTTPPTAAAAATTQAVVSKYGKETYWPSSLERECEKAALILKSFCSKFILMAFARASLAWFNGRAVKGIVRGFAANQNASPATQPTDFFHTSPMLAQNCPTRRH